MSGESKSLRKLYESLWTLLENGFRVPSRPPTLSLDPGEEVHSFRPAEGFLRYLKFKFWFWLTLIDGALLVGWLATTWFFPLLGVALSPVFLIVAVAPDVVAYVAIHLRYDTTWYVLSTRSLRIRRGIWVIRETTFTFENVQNLRVRQGPLQRYYGIFDLMVETAGGSRDKAEGAEDHHVGLIEGVADAERIRDLILDRLKGTQSDPSAPATAPPLRESEWEARHVAALAAVRDELVILTGGLRQAADKQPLREAAECFQKTEPWPLPATQGEGVAVGDLMGAEPQVPQPHTGLLAQLLRLPAEVPGLAAEASGRVRQFRPGFGLRRYWVLSRWLVCGVVSSGFLLAAATFRVVGPSAGREFVFFSMAGVFSLLIGAVLHLTSTVRYRMMWYAVGERSVRLRTGLWTIREITITYENLQNIKLKQGPLQRLFGISTLELYTAGGSSRRDLGSENPALKVLLVLAEIATMALPGGAGFSGSFGTGQAKGDQTASARMEGLTGPEVIREAIFKRIRLSATAGLGDEAATERRPGMITSRHLEVLGEIRRMLGALGQ